MLPQGEVMPRHLTGGHTHLYTEQSIKHLIAEYGWKISGQWWFGNDLVDLYRSMLVRLEKTHCIGDGQIKKKFGESLIDSIDSMQLVLDTKHASSEVHLILSRESS